MKSVEEHRLQGHFKVLGRPCCLVYTTLDSEMQASQPFRTLFMQEMISRGILAPSFVVSKDRYSTQFLGAVSSRMD
jgi:glutamate-1-semialdehyde 2,1-aminomutase